ncbi:DUF4347 domain-containing protein, partial [Laspinema palackyanum]|uniref:DUF4347 domain-containing protein n=1 Tax=Laspinema palackyanum TaxID=3231601 RepID=UPI00345C7E41|nr:DUF4347 domain-containing protein [Laspinema sp. D2c]
MPFLLPESTSPLYPIWENTSPREILFADPTVTGYETLIASTPAELQVVVLDPNRDAIAQISEILSHQKQPLDGLHILSHAQSGMLHLGNQVFTAETLPEAEISQWAKFLTSDADIQLYGCNLAADLGGFVDRLAAITGADIAASDNLTGNAALGGDWELEARTGAIEVQIPFSAEAIGAYQNVLAPQITLPSGNLTYTENGGFAILDPNATATDPNSPNFNGGTLTINFTSGATTDDILMIRNEGGGFNKIVAGIDSPGLNGIWYNSPTPFATFTGGTQGRPLTINFTTNATHAAVSALMRNISYGNISDKPLEGDRTVRFQVTGAPGGASIPVSKTINFTTANDAPLIAIPGASFPLYDSTNTPDTPNDQGFEYRTLPYRPIAATQNGPNLNTSGDRRDYAGYIARPDRIPLLDRNTGYNINFTAQILAEDHSIPSANTPNPDKNGDGLADRAGFSLIAISSDGKKGIEIGFWKDRIWVQEAGAAEPPAPPNPEYPLDTYTLFTHKLNSPESVTFPTTNTSVYQLEVLGETYQLLANGIRVISGKLRDYSNASRPSFLPANPYTTPNFIFFGDNTPSASAEFNLSAVSVTTGSSLLPLSVDEDTSVVIPGISVADADAGPNAITVTLTVNHGTLTVNSGVTGGLAATNINANGTNSVILTGTISQINQVLADTAGLIYQGFPNFNGPDTLTVIANDVGNGGGGALTDTKTVPITVNPVNDAPVLTLPTNQVVNQSINLSIPGISVADVDTGTQPLRVNLSATNGFLTLNNFLNLTFVNGDGTGDQSMSFTGTLAEINSALSILTYQSGANYSGADTINITVNDLGNTGKVAPLEVAGNIPITVNPKGVLTLNEHSVSQILDQFPPASTSLPDHTVWHRFRLSAVHEPIITNHLTFAVTATGIGNTNFSNLQLISDVNNNGIYDPGDLQVGTMEMPLDITDGIRVSSFTVPIGDNNYLLIGGLNGLQAGSTLSVGLNSSNIVAANGNSIPISANGTVTQAGHIVEAIVTQEIPPANNSGTIPPANNSGTIPPANNSGTIPPENNSGTIPPGNNSGTIP